VTSPEPITDGDVLRQIAAEQAARVVALAKRESRRSLAVIIGLATISVAAIVLLTTEGQGAIAAQLVGYMAPTIAAMLAYRKSADNGAAIHKVELNVDGRLSQLLAKTDAAARAEGHAAGTAARRTRDTDIPGG
jgi:hypothetical protein